MKDSIETWLGHKQDKFFQTATDAEEKIANIALSFDEKCNKALERIESIEKAYKGG